MDYIKKIIDNIKLWVIPRLVYILLKLTNWTINLKVVGRENIEDINKDIPLLYSFWHGYMWIPVYYYRNRDHIALSSLSRDGEYMTRVLRRLGWQVIRGSSSRGGSRSVLKLYKKLLKGANTVLTPDGPTGPIYKVKPGIIYLQEKSEGYIVPLGISVDRKLRVNSWDKFILPLPWTKAVLKIGQPVQFSGEKSIDDRCEILEEKMNQVQGEADSILSSWKGKEG
mgnify:CR=1 FL=1